MACPVGSAAEKATDKANNSWHVMASVKLSSEKSLRLLVTELMALLWGKLTCKLNKKRKERK